MVHADQDVAEIGWDRAARFGVLALALNGFAVIAVNYWIYTARWWFIERQGQVYKKPPTISRAISDPVIGEPFSMWITISGIFLAIGVTFLVVHYMRLSRFTKQPGRYLRFALWVAMPAIVLLQVSASLGMHWLSSYRFPQFHEMHMTGSYLFFISQALVILLFVIFNHALLSDGEALQQIVAQGRISRRWVRVRLIAGLGSLGLVALYFALFTLKDIYEWPTAPVLYIAYVSVEPMVITSFLIILGLCHIDQFPRRRA